MPSFQIVLNIFIGALQYLGYLLKFANYKFIKFFLYVCKQMQSFTLYKPIIYLTDISNPLFGD